MFAGMHQQGRPSITLEVYALGDRPVPQQVGDGSALCTFNLPELRSGVFPLDLSIHSDPSPGTNAGFPDAPFGLNPGCITFAIRFRAMPVMTEGADLEVFVLFVPLKVLLAHLAKHNCRQGNDGPRSIPWHVWGPDHTRLLCIPDAPGRQWLSAYGTRYIVPPGSNSPGARLYDFNPRAGPGTGALEFERVTSPNIIDSWVFTDRVTTQLPYTVRSFVMPGVTSDLQVLLLSEDHIICVGAQGIHMLTF
jgi:hypothetical protein